jgi:hypothetical protein
MPRCASASAAPRATGGADGDLLGPGGGAGRGGWWRGLFGKRREMAKEDHLASPGADAPKRTGPAADARDRLARRARPTLRPVPRARGACVRRGRRRRAHPRPQD